ncbi:MAG: hypothetical protein CM1200mP20_01250 [Pseudomonadota bacterium]|nr:MAG: hypothetical protein CM1200mP20_01250 [Pseudomonadota bacterium]
MSSSIRGFPTVLMERHSPQQETRTEPSKLILKSLSVKTYPVNPNTPKKKDIRGLVVLL